MKKWTPKEILFEAGINSGFSDMLFLVSFQSALKDVLSHPAIAAYIPIAQKEFSQPPLSNYSYSQ